MPGSSPLDRARTAASSPRNDLVKNCRVHPTHWLISTQVAASKQWLSYSMRAWLPGGKQAPEPTPEESKSLSHFRVGNVLEPIEPLTGIARHPFARVGCGGGVDLCGNQIYGAF